MTSSVKFITQNSSKLLTWTPCMSAKPLGGLRGNLALQDVLCASFSKKSPGQVRSRSHDVIRGDTSGYLSAFLATFSPVARTPMFWPWEGSNYPSRSCNGPYGPKGPKFKQNKTSGRFSSKSCFRPRNLLSLTGAEKLCLIQVRRRPSRLNSWFMGFVRICCSFNKESNRAA